MAITFYAITFYYGSGSPFSWNIWLTLEHKQLPYTFKLMSLQEGDLKTPTYRSINPRGKVPALVDEGYALWESTPIVEYLEERYPDHPVLPRDPRDRATARRLAAEVSHYLYPVVRRLLDETLFRRDGDSDATRVAAALEGLQRELDYFEDALRGEYCVSSLSTADFSLYPLLALIRRVHVKQPQYATGARIGPRLTAFMQRIEGLPYFAKTMPPHWMKDKII